MRRAWGLERSSSETPAGVHIAYLQVPAGDRGWEVTLQRQSLEFRTAHSPKAIPVRGSVVYLHGWGMDSTSMLGWAMAFAEHGYDGYALDLRNHGASDRAPAYLRSRVSLRRTISGGSTGSGLTTRRSGCREPVWAVRLARSTT